MFVVYLYLLAFLFLCSMFFSAAETAYFSVNKYRLAGEAQGLTAQLTLKLYKRPDRLLSLVLLGNNFVNVSIAAIFSLLTVRYAGEHFLFLTSLGTTFLILVFCEAVPKSFALRYSLGFVKASALILYPLQKILTPVLFLIGGFIETIHKFGARLKGKEEGVGEQSFTELRGAVLEARNILSEPHRNMLMFILDIRYMLVEEVMVRLGEFESLDLNGSSGDILRDAAAANRTHLVVYRNSLTNCLGFINASQLVSLFRTSRPTKRTIRALVEKATYIPGGVTLLNQLEHFVESEHNHAFVVDEYGEIQGMIGLHDIMGRITGSIGSLTQLSADGSLLVNGDTSLRDINKKLGVNLALKQATTLQGWMQERVESLPAGPICLLEDNCRIEIYEVKKGRIVTARIWRQNL